MNIIEAIEDYLLFKRAVQGSVLAQLACRVQGGGWLGDDRRGAGDLQHPDRETPPATQPKKPGSSAGGEEANRIAALMATSLGCFQDYRQRLPPGERIAVMVLACDRRQARVIFRYTLGMLNRSRCSGHDRTPGYREHQPLQRVDLEITTNSYRRCAGSRLARRSWMKSPIGGLNSPPIPMRKS